MDINAGNLNTLFRGFNAGFQRGLTSASDADMYKQIATVAPSSTAEQEYGWLGDMPAIREWIGDRQVNRIKTDGYKIKNRKFEQTVGVKRDSIEEDQFGVYGPMFEALGENEALFPNQLTFGLLAAGFTTNCYDGQRFFDTDHPVGEGVVSNFGGGSGTPWYLLNTKRKLKPLIFQDRERGRLIRKDQETDSNVFDRDEFIYGTRMRCNVGFGFWQMAYGSRLTLDATNFNAAYAAMSSFKRDNGSPLAIKPNLLVVPPSLRAIALELVKAEKNAAGATNINRDVVDVLVCEYL
jgi:phage major head subunit gpT-like protein